MMTLKELCEQNKVPFKARNIDFPPGVYNEILWADKYLAVCRPGPHRNDEVETFSRNLSIHPQFYGKWELYIEPKKKQKLQAWIHGSVVHLFPEGEFCASHEWKRIPGLDQEIDE